MPSKAKRGTYLPLPSCRKVFRCFQESRAPSLIMVTLENEHDHTLPSCFFPQLYMLSMTLYGLEYPFDQSGSSAASASHPSFSCIPSSSLVKWTEAEEVLTLCKHCSATVKATQLSTVTSKSKPYYYSTILNKIIFIPAETSTPLLILQNQM